MAPRPSVTRSSSGSWNATNRPSRVAWTSVSTWVLPRATAAAKAAMVFSSPSREKPRCAIPSGPSTSRYGCTPGTLPASVGLSAGELPVPRLGLLAVRLRPAGVEPAVERGVREHPGVLGGAEGLDAAAQVERRAPPVVARARACGQGRLLRVHADLGRQRPIGVRDAQGRPELGGVGLGQPLESRGRVRAEQVTGRPPERAEGRGRDRAVAERRRVQTAAAAGSGGGTGGGTDQCLCLLQPHLLLLA